MLDMAQEIAGRTAFIRDMVNRAGANGVVFGNSGGKDCALVGILCTLAGVNALGVIMPCGSKQNYGSDRQDAEELARQYGIETRVVDLTVAKEAMLTALGKPLDSVDAAANNIPPRLRMTTLYAIAAQENRLVVGTGNRSERYMGYFTKWGDGAFDFNPISDLTVTEIYAMLRYLKAPASIIDKAPSAGLCEGQTDELEMGVSYAAVDAHLRGENVSDQELTVIQRYHSRSAHKLTLPPTYR